MSVEQEIMELIDRYAVVSASYNYKARAELKDQIAAKLKELRQAGRNDELMDRIASLIEEGD